MLQMKIKLVTMQYTRTYQINKERVDLRRYTPVERVKGTNQ